MPITRFPEMQKATGCKISRPSKI